jgi:hypothetical protein
METSSSTRVPAPAASAPYRLRNHDSRSLVPCREQFTARGNSRVPSRPQSETTHATSGGCRSSPTGLTGSWNDTQRLSVHPHVEPSQEEVQAGARGCAGSWRDRRAIDEGADERTANWCTAADTAPKSSHGGRLSLIHLGQRPNHVAEVHRAVRRYSSRRVGLSVVGVAHRSDFVVRGFHLEELPLNDCPQFAG